MAEFGRARKGIKSGKARPAMSRSGEIPEGGRGQNLEKPEWLSGLK